MPVHHIPIFNHCTVVKILLNLSRFIHFADMKTCFHQFSPLISHLISLRGLRRWCPAFRLCCGAGRLCPLLHLGEVRYAAGRNGLAATISFFLVKTVNYGKHENWRHVVHWEQYILGSTTFMSDITPVRQWSASRLVLFMWPFASQSVPLGKSALEISGMFKFASAKALGCLEYVRPSKASDPEEN